MNLNKSILTLLIVLAMLYSSSVLGQSSGNWIIPPGVPSHITPGYMDSLNLIPSDPTNPPGYDVGQDSIGKPMLWSDIYVLNIATKEKATNYICGEKYWVKLVAQRDTITNILEYSTATTSIDSTGNDFWTETINVSVVESTEIIINSPVDVKAKLYEAYELINPTFEELTVTGSGLNQSFTVNMKNGVPYIIVFIKNENTIVYAKRIGG